jgi:N-acetylneuraminic acid mutarotase
MLFAAVLAGIASWSCGGSSGSSTPPPPPATYSIGGTLSGLSGTVVLQNDGGDNLSLTNNGTFTFTTSVASGGAYKVTVLTQPTGQTCAVTSGSGTATANVTSVQVSCTANLVNAWTWVSGANIVNQVGVYGTLGTAAPGNVPGARDSATSWIDPSGNLWLFGGGFNDLWKYSAGEWTWMSGSSSSVSQKGVYGTLGKADSANVPGSRGGAAGWTDASGNLWLFGGTGTDSTGANGQLNDLWEYSAGEWTWMGGSDTVGASGIYGVELTAASTNVPGARHYASTWVDSAGTFWLFGGVGFDVNGNFAPLNDLWKYSSGEWTWMSGAKTINQNGTYGTKGTAAAANTPGSRSSAVTWVDASGNFWLFAGGGWDSAGTLGFLNDLWKYSGGQWTWMGGSNLANQPAIYGTLGTAASTNTPAGRIQFVSWTDPAGTFWLFGGYGRDSTGSTGQLDDLWKYSGGEWTWVSGSNLNSPIGVYGTLGVSAATNLPGGRQAPVAWADSAGNLWLFGGYGYDSAGAAGELNDLWEYQP